MFRLGRPADDDLGRVLAEQSAAQPTYREIGATRGPLPSGYQHDHHVADLGRGRRAFDRAGEGLRNWEAHRGAGLLLVPERPGLAEGVTVVVVKHLPGLAAVAACRVIYVVDEPDAFGFAYGTLPAHPEQGEESFIVRRGSDDAVTFTITAFSRPRHPLARLGGPVTRQIQLATTRDYLRALQAHTAG